MARFRGNAQGEVIQFLATYQQEQQYGGNPPPDMAYEVFFDETTNPGVVTAYNANSASFTIPGGTVCQNATPVTFNPDSIAYAGFRNYAAFVTKLKETNDPITRGELAEALGLIFRDLGRAV